MKINKVVFASSNLGKITEIQALMPQDIRLISQQKFGIGKEIPLAIENASTFVENALIKARLASKVSGLPAIADDSGLLVNAINNLPGIYTARYAGEQASDEDNINKLLQELKGIKNSQRGASFHAVLVFLKNPQDPSPLIAHSTWKGSILHKPQGKRGFGYDPIFYIEDKKCSAAELSMEEKNSLSHRAKACKLLLNMMSRLV